MILIVSSVIRIGRAAATRDCDMHPYAGIVARPRWLLAKTYADT
jgi:hypothetical protein